MFMSNTNLIVKDSSVHGLGLFSKYNYTEGQIITKIDGEMIDAGECIRREEQGNVYIFYKDENEYIDASNHALLKYLNHSCNYNCEIEEDENGNLILLAASEIKSGDELTIDYGYEEIYQYCTCSDCDNKNEINSDEANLS